MDHSTTSRSSVKVRKAEAQDVGDYMAHSPQRGDREGQGGFMRSTVSCSGALGIAMMEWRLRAANGTQCEIGGRDRSSCSVCLQVGPYNPFVLPALKTQLKKSAFLQRPQDVRICPYLILSQWLLLT